ncbi:MAG TPA: NRDE family protein [Candidatus Polarisedimenticolaceae bacterium]
MCTVAYVPLPGGGYLLGHNRDERLSRGRGAVPSQGDAAGRRWLAPRDPDAGGTWIVANDAGLTVCVLNALETEGRALPDNPRSRGLLVAEAAGCRGLDEVRARIDAALPELAATRAFRLVAAEDGAGLSSCVWDGVALAWERAASTTLYVSSTLGAFGAPAARLAAWEAMRRRAGDPDEPALAAWLAGHEPERGPASVCMHREDGGTVSRTIVRVDRARVAMTYTDGPPCTPFAPPSTWSIPRAAWSDRSVR